MFRFTTLFSFLCRLAARLLLRLTVTGLENVPRSGGLLVTMNHLGGADPVLLIGFTPRTLAVIGKAEIFNWPVVGRVARAYGMIPVQRGTPDRVTLQTAVDLIRAGGALLIAPEGRESLSHALEQGKAGTAFITLHSGATLQPVAITGTEWARVLAAWRKLQRPCVTLTFGPPYRLPPELKRPEAVAEIMRHLAALLPPEYRGVYGEQLADGR